MSRLLAIGVPISVLGILAAEFGIRAAAKRLPKPLDWHSWPAQHKAAAMEALAHTGGASVVAVGSSIINSGLNAELLTDLLGVERPVFNAALNGASTRTVEPWTLDVVLPYLRPDLVVFGLHTLELNDNSTAGPRSLKMLKRSFGWRRLNRAASRAQRLFLWFEERSFLVRYRRFLFEPAIARRAHPMRHRFQRFRDDPLHLLRRSRGGGSSVSRLGVPDALKSFQERKYSIRGERIRKIWMEQYINDYDVGGAELAALRRLVEGVRATGASLLVVLMPTTDEWAGLHPGGQGDVERFERILGSFLTDNEVPFVDLTPGFSSHEHFVDPIHLNQGGMTRFTEELSHPIVELIGSRGTAVQEIEQ